MFTMVRLQTDNGTSLGYNYDKLAKWVSEMTLWDLSAKIAFRNE